MSAESSGVFTLKEINRVKIIEDVIERHMTTRRAAEYLGITATDNVGDCWFVLLRVTA